MTEQTVSTSKRGRPVKNIDESIINKIITLRNTGLSYRQIITAMNDDGIPVTMYRVHNVLKNRLV